MIAVGAVAERGRIGPLLVFVFVWSTLVYGTRAPLPLPRRTRPNAPQTPSHAGSGTRTTAGPPSSAASTLPAARPCTSPAVSPATRPASPLTRPAPAGTAALAISVYLGKRRGYGTERLAYKPHSTSHVVLGTVFLWYAAPSPRPAR